MPQAHNGPDTLYQMEWLYVEIYIWAFDKGFFTIKYLEDDYIVDVHTNVKSNELLKEN